MKCKKCKKQIPDDAKFCCYCGRSIKIEKMYRRPDGLYEKIITVSGKRVAFRGKTEKEVNHKILEYHGRVERGRTFRELAESWSDEHFAAISYNTLKSYKPAYERALEHFGDTPVKQITRANIAAFIEDFARKKYAHKTVRNQLLVLSLIFKRGVLEGDLETSPAEYVTVPKNLPRKKRELPPVNYVDLIKTNVDKDFGLLAYFLLYTGCRRGEALALQFRDIDREQMVIHITKSLYHESNRPKIKEPKTEAGRRDIILLDCLAEKIPQGKPDSYLFTDEYGELITRSGFHHRWNAYCKAIGAYDEKIYTDKDGHTHSEIVALVTPHQLRHAYATILYEAGIDEKDAQELMGHTTIAMTRDIYTHITDARRAETAKKLNDFTGI